MRRIITLAILVYLLILVGVGSLQGPLVALAIPPAIYILAGLFAAPRRMDLRVTRLLSAERTAPGMPVTVTLEIENAGAGVEELEIADPLPAELEILEGSPRRLFSLRRGQRLTWSYRISGRRGYYLLDHVNVRQGEFLGMASRTSRIETHGQLFILPTYARLSRVAIRPRLTRVYSGTIPARQGGPGIEFFGVREYAPGDSLRWVNWRVTARHPQTLFSNEFEQERVADVGIILDARKRANDYGFGHSLFEHSVLATSSLAGAFLTAGNRVGLMVYGKYVQWTAPGYGKVQHESILTDLARAEIGESEAFKDLIIPRRLFPAYSQMVVVSPLLHDDLEVLLAIRSAGYPLMVICPDPVSFEISHLGESPNVRLAARIVRLDREILLTRLRRAGVQLVNWDTRLPFEQAARAALSRPPAFLRAIGWEG